MWRKWNLPPQPVGVENGQLMWRTVWQFLNVRVTTWSSDSTPRYIPREIKHICTKMCTQMCTAAAFITAKRWKQPNSLSVGEWPNKMCSILKWNMIQPWKEIKSRCPSMTSLENPVLREGSWTQMAQLVWFYLYKMSRWGKYMRPESRAVVSRGWRREWGWLSVGYRSFFFFFF